MWCKAPFGANKDGHKELVDAFLKGRVAEPMVTYACASIEIPTRVGHAEHRLDVEAATQ